MARRPSLSPKTRFEVQLPPELVAKMGLRLYSEVEERVPLGHYSQFVESCIRKELEYETLDLSLFGFAPGYFVRGPQAVIDSLRSALETTTGIAYG